MSFTSRSGNVARDTQGLEAKLVSLLRSPNRIAIRLCDSSVATDIRALVQSSPKHSALLHMSHVLKDRVISNMHSTDFAFVFSAKATGAALLRAAEATRPLEVFRLFSSGASYGGFGIAAHSAANAYLDGLALHESAHGLVARATVIPIVLGAGAGAAVALAAITSPDDDFLDPSIRAMVITMDELLEVLFQSFLPRNIASGASHQFEP